MSYIVRDKDKTINLLFPLIGIPYETGISCYSYWNQTEDSIENYNLILLLKKKLDVSFLKNISAYYQTGKGEVYIINMFKYKETFKAFLLGKYSKFNGEDKKKIIKFWGCAETKEKQPTGYSGHPCPWHIILYPELYYEDVAKELYEEKYKIGLKYIQQHGELWSKPNKEMETLTCEITSNCEINYNQLTLFS